MPALHRHRKLSNMASQIVGHLILARQPRTRTILARISIWPLKFIASLATFIRQDGSKSHCTGPASTSRPLHDESLIGVADPAQNGPSKRAPTAAFSLSAAIVPSRQDLRMLLIENTQLNRSLTLLRFLLLDYHSCCPSRSLEL